MRGAYGNDLLRLSGEYPRHRFYTKSRAATGFLSGGGYGLKGGGGFGPKPGKPLPSPGFFDPFNPPPTGPQPADPRSAPLPFKPLNHNAKRFGQKAPFAPRPPVPLGGISGKGYKILRRLVGPAGFILGFIPEPLWNGGRGVVWWDLPSAGFILKCDAPPNGGYTYVPNIPYSGPDTRSTEGVITPNLNCLVDGQVADDNLTNGAGVIAADTRWVAIGPDNHGVVVRMQLRQQWTRPNGTYAPLPALPGAGTTGIPQRWGLPFPDAPIWPAIDPFGLPIGQPAPTPVPIPYRVIPERRGNPLRDRLEQPGGSEPSTAPQPAPGQPGTGVPADEVVIPAGPDGGFLPPVQRPTIHLRLPPGRRVREGKKLIHKGVWNFLNGAVGLITESLDLLGVFFDSLPPEIRRQYQWKGGSPVDRLAFVLHNLEHIQLGHLIANIIANQLEDMAFGTLGKNASKMNKLLYENFGIDIQGRTLKRSEMPYVEDWVTAWLDEWLGSNVYDPIVQNTGNL